VLEAGRGTITRGRSLAAIRWAAETMKVARLLVVAGGIGLACSHGPTLNPVKLRQAAKLRGPNAVVAELYNVEPDWDAFLQGVSSGSPEWLDLAAALAPGTDAGATSMLGIALFLALGPAPERVLRLLAAPSGLRDAYFSVEDVCGSNVYIDYSPPEARGLISARLGSSWHCVTGACEIPRRHLHCASTSERGCCPTRRCT